MGHFAVPCLGARVAPTPFHGPRASSQPMKLFPIIIVTTLATALASCASDPFKDNYEPVISRHPPLSPYSGITQVSLSDDPANDAESLRKSGATLLGVSSYESSHLPRLADLQALGKQIGADLVIYGGSLMGSEQRFRSVYEPIPASPSISQTMTVNNYASPQSGPVVPTFEPAPRQPPPQGIVTQVPFQVNYYQWQAFFFRAKP